MAQEERVREATSWSDGEGGTKCLRCGVKGMEALGEAMEVGAISQGACTERDGSEVGCETRGCWHLKACKDSSCKIFFLLLKGRKIRA